MDTTYGKNFDEVKDLYLMHRFTLLIKAIDFLQLI
jgi:hypothetical protein